VIDDSTGRTIVSASSQEALKENGGNAITPKIAISTVVGKMVAQRALAEGVTKVVFDRGGCKYHGRVKALAEATRQGGLEF